jgi:hypothetical protein
VPGTPYIVFPCSSYSCGGNTYTGTQMATNTVQYVSERGMSCDVSGALTPMYNCVHKIVSNRSLEISKWFFGCDTMNGIELDNHDTGSACAVMSSHLETRVFPTTVRNAMCCSTIQSQQYLSAADEPVYWIRVTVYYSSTTGSV